MSSSRRQSHSRKSKSGNGSGSNASPLNENGHKDFTRRKSKNNVTSTGVEVVAHVIDPRLCYINKLPDELIIHILSFLEPDNLARANLICREWLKLVQDDSCWKEAMIKYFGGLPLKRLTRESWREEYIQRATILRNFQTYSGPATIYDSGVSNLSNLFIDWDIGKCLVGCTEQGVVSISDPMSGKVSKDLIYCTPIMNSEPVSSIEIESGRIAVGFPSGHIALVKDFKFNSIHRTFQLITLPLSFGTQAAIQSSGPHAQHQTAVKVLKWVGTTREQLLLSGSIDGQIRLWDLSKKVREDAGCCVAYLEGGKTSISHISVDQSNNFVVGAASKYIQIWSVDFSTISRTEANVSHLVAVIPPSRQITLDSSISHLHFNHQSFPYIIVSTQASQFLSIYNVITGDLIATCKNGHVESITAINVLIISPRSNTFTSQSSISSALSHSPSPSPSPSFSNSELGFRHLPHIMILSGDQTGRLVLWNIPESSLRHISNSVSTFSSSSSFALSPSTSSFPSASIVLRGHEHDPVAFEPFKTLTGHADKITCIESDEVKIVSGSLDGWTKIWEPISGRCVQNFSSRLRNNARVAHPQHDPDNSRKAVKSIQMGIYQVVVGLVSGIVKTFDFEKNREPGSLIKKRPKKKRHSVSQRHKPYNSKEIRQQVRETRTALDQETKQREKWSRKLSQVNGYTDLSEEELLQMALQISLSSSLEEQSRNQKLMEQCEMKEMEAAVKQSLQVHNYGTAIESPDSLSTSSSVPAPVNIPGSLKPTSSTTKTEWVTPSSFTSTSSMSSSTTSLHSSYKSTSNSISLSRPPIQSQPPSTQNTRSNEDDRNLQDEEDYDDDRDYSEDYQTGGYFPGRYHPGRYNHRSSRSSHGKVNVQSNSSNSRRNSNYGGDEDDEELMYVLELSMQDK